MSVSMPRLAAIAQSIHDYAQQVLVDSSDLVVIDADCLPGIDELLEPKLQSLEPFCEARLGRRATLGLEFFFGTVNYCFTNPENLLRFEYRRDSGTRYFGALALWSAMADYPIDWGDFDKVRHLSGSELRAFATRDELGVLYDEGRFERVVSLADFLCGRGFQQVDDLLPFLANGNDVISLLMDSELFLDVFFKRAQLTIARVSSRLVSHWGFSVEGRDALTGMPDYRLPQLLQTVGAIRLQSDQLMSSIRDRRPLQRWGREEQALRAATIEIIRLLSLHAGLPEADVDSRLWGLAQRMEGRGAMRLPHMLVATDEY